MKTKAVLIDFDGTIATKDILDVVCEIVGKEEESHRIMEEAFAGKRDGLESLITRINFLKGVSLDQINQKLAQNDYLMPGAKELFDYLNSKGIISILNSGNLIPVLAYYKEKLGITHLVGSKPKMDGNKIVGISQDDYPASDFKLAGCKKILKQEGIKQEEVVAIGDSPADRGVFNFAKKSIAINPRNGMEKEVDFVINNNLSEVIDIINNLGNN